MILAAADYGLHPKDHKAPSDLLRAIHCQNWHIPPASGDYDEMPAGLLSRMEELYRVWEAHYEMMQNLDNYEEWQKYNRSKVGLIARIKKMREEAADAQL